MKTIIKETCCCGAEFYYEGDKLNAAFRYVDFLKAHEICRTKKANSNEAKKAKLDEENDQLYL